jgi:hypothetical protein
LSLATASQLQPASAELALLSSAYDQQCDECRAAKDPNEMHGPEGDLLPGQLLTYKIDYENVGAGQAYDVFIVNDLSEHFDLATLQVPDNATVSLAARTIFFEVGELAPKGQPGSTGQITYSVRLKAGLPSGTVISNQAVVHFPSVPEETPTNVVVNTVQPIVVTPLALQTAFGQPVAVKLQGQDISNMPLTFAVVDAPLYGALTGAPPNLVYQPAPGFAGPDRFTFTASNGAATSRPADVTIQVLPDANDHQSPRVLWTAPADGEWVSSSTTVATGDGGTLYTPRLQIQFSEVMDARTVTTATLEVKAPDGRRLPVNVYYDASVDQALVLLGAEPQAGMAYTVTLKRAVTDVAGNALDADVSWTFQIGAGPTAQAGAIFLPALQK